VTIQTADTNSVEKRWGMESYGLVGCDEDGACGGQSLDYRDEDGYEDEVLNGMSSTQKVRQGCSKCNYAVKCQRCTCMAASLTCHNCRMVSHLASRCWQERGQ